jgi:glycosyltransferase involved in cell wall biosynthesis
MNAVAAGDDRIRVLLIAELCNPDWSSIPLEGWHHSQALARVAETHLVTQIRNRENLLKAGLVEGKDFTAIDSGRVEKPITWAIAKLGASVSSGKGWTTQTAAAVITYQYFEHLLWRRFGPAIRAGAFDVVHRITPLSPTIPSPLAARCRAAGVPFVLGPLNGGLPWPKQFSGLRAKEQEWLSYVREAYKLVPGYRSTRRNASAIIVGSRATAGQLDAAYRDKAVYIPENAVDPDRFGLQAPDKVTLPLRIAFVGRLVPYKGPDMLLDAIAPLARDGKVQLCIIGDGPEMPALRAQVEREGISDRVEFAGWLQYEEIPRRLANAHVFGFPSVREFGGAVVLETMSLGLVPVVVDYGGPGEHVSATTGFAVPLGTRDEIVSRFRNVFERLIADPSIIAPMGRRARERAIRSFTWSAKAEQVAEVYRWVLNRRDKPDFDTQFRDRA